MQALRSGLTSLGLTLGLALVASNSHAKSIVFLTENRVTLRDTANLSVEIDGLNFVLPSGFRAVGGDQDPNDEGFIHILGRNDATGKCQVFEQVDFSGDTLPLVADGPAVNCSATVGDLEMQNMPFDPAHHLIADGNVIRAHLPADNETFDYPVFPSGNVTVDLVALAQRAENEPTYVINRGGTGAIGELGETPNDDGLLINVFALSGAVISGPTSLDISQSAPSTSGPLYLLTSGNLYTVTPQGVATLIGAAPTGALAAWVDTVGTGGGGGGGGGGSGGGDDDDDSSGNIKVGALNVWMLIPLALLAALRSWLPGRRQAARSTRRVR